MLVSSNGEDDLGAGRIQRTQPEVMLEVLDSARQINWVALRSNEPGVLSGTAPYIATHCYDYYTLRLDSERLLVTLGHA